MPATQKAGHLGVLVIIIAILIAGAIVAYLYFTSNNYAVNTGNLNSYGVNTNATTDVTNLSVNTNTNKANINSGQANLNTSVNASSNTNSATTNDIDSLLNDASSAGINVNSSLNELNNIDATEDDALSF